MARSRTLRAGDCIRTLTTWELGDLTELAASIKENGIFQNLTVIPNHYLNSREYIAKCVDEGAGMPQQQRQHGRRLCGPARTTPSSSATAGPRPHNRQDCLKCPARGRGNGRKGTAANHDD